MSLSRVNTILSIGIILVGIASIGNAQSLTLTKDTKTDLYKNAKQVLELAKATRDQLKNDPKNIESNGTIAEQFGLIAEQADSILELMMPMLLDTSYIDNRYVIELFSSQLKELRTLLGNEFDKYSPEVSKQDKLLKEIKIQQKIATDNMKNFQSQEPIANQFKTYYSQLYGMEQAIYIKARYTETLAIGTVQAMKVLDAAEAELTQIINRLKSLTEKYSKQ